MLKILYPSYESHRRVVVKSTAWRALGVLVLAFITYNVTREWLTTTLITVTHHLIFIFLYYGHDRLWIWTSFLRRSRLKPFSRIITYELILGNLVLAAISWIFTGSLQEVTVITLTYILNKCWMYYTYDYIWGKVRWQAKA